MTQFRFTRTTTAPMEFVLPTDGPDHDSVHQGHGGEFMAKDMDAVTVYCDRVGSAT